MRKPGAQGHQAGGAIARMMQRAAMAYARGEWAEAERCCRQIMATRSNFFDALNLMGVIAAQTRRLAEAASLLGRAAGANPGDATVHNNYANVLRELKRLDEALAGYDRALKLRPGYAEAWHNRGNTLWQLRRYDEALESYDRALQFKPDYAEACNNRGNLLRELKRFEEALQSYDRALQLKPDFAEAHNDRGNVLWELRRFEDALHSCDRALHFKPDYADAHNNRGNALRGLHRLEDALHSYDLALALRPDSAEIHNNRGNTLRELGRFDDALGSYDRALTLRPDYAETHNNRGVTLHETGRHQDALDSYERALALRADYAEAFNNRGNTLRELKRFEEALGSFRKALECDPGLVRVYQPLGELLNRMGRGEEATAVYLGWLEADPTSPVAQHMYAAASGRNVPERCDSRYVTALFDDFARSFDATLERLDYAVPQALGAMLASRAPIGQGGLDVLDAGCGTGLCGPPLRSMARFLTGLDLSPGMLAKARVRHVYDELVQAELVEFMESRPQRFDVVNCADTLIYIGALERVMAAAHRCLRPTGVFAFTVEALPEAVPDGFRLTMTGRYAHSGRYVRQVMASAGFMEAECRTIDLRKEAGAGVRGYLFLGAMATAQ
jgi:predicted TPR repeat methyltransferase